MLEGARLVIHTGDKHMPLEWYKRFLEFFSLSLQATTRPPRGLEKSPQCHIYDFIKQMNIACSLSENILYEGSGVMALLAEQFLSDLKKKSQQKMNALDQK